MTSAREEGQRKGKEDQTVDVLQESKLLTRIGRTISWLGWLGAFLAFMGGVIYWIEIAIRPEANGLEVFYATMAAFVGPVMLGLAAAALGHILTLVATYVGMKSRY